MGFLVWERCEWPPGGQTGRVLSTSSGQGPKPSASPWRYHSDLCHGPRGSVSLPALAIHAGKSGGCGKSPGFRALCRLEPASPASPAQFCRGSLSSGQPVQWECRCFPPLSPPPTSQGMENTAWLPWAAETAVAFEVCCNFLSNIHPRPGRTYSSVSSHKRRVLGPQPQSPPSPQTLPAAALLFTPHPRPLPPSPCHFSLLQIVTGMESHSAKPFLSHLFTRWRVPRVLSIRS